MQTQRTACKLGRRRVGYKKKWPSDVLRYHSISERRILCLSYHLGSRQEPLLHGRLTNNSNKDDLELKLVALNGHLVPRKCNGRDPELTQTCNAK